MRSNMILKLAVIFLLVMVSTRVFSQEAEKKIPPAVSAFVDGFIQNYNVQNFRAIYRDLSSGRFKASENLVNFNDSLLNVFDDLGAVQNYEIDYLLHENYNFGEFVFYRLQLTVQHLKGETIQRLVLMKRKNVENLELDGYAVNSRGLFYLAIGNLYNFTLKDLVGEKDPLWTSRYFNTVWQDSTKDYMRSDDYKKKVNENMKKSLWYLVQGDLDTALTLAQDPGDSKIENYAATETYANGKTKWIIPYVKGKKRGEAKFFYETGELWQVAHYQNNMIHGDFTEFYPDGKIKLRARYLNGVPVGESEAFYEDGKTKAKFDFVFGPLLYKYKEFGRDGSLKMEGVSVVGKEI